MSNIMRWRYGDTNPVIAPVQSAEVIEIGDLLYYESGYAKTASSATDQLNKADNQEEFHNAFLGVAMQSSPASESQSIRIATTGVFEFDCLSTTFVLGEFLAPDEDSGGTFLEPQIVVKPTINAKTHAIGRCAKQENTATTKVLIDIVSSILRGGTQSI